MMRSAWAVMMMVGLLAGVVSAEQVCRVDSGAKPTVLVELYTSEGCSSCPPADRWLGELDQPSEDLIALALHVPYWDYIGWPDRFANRRFELRQRDLASRQGTRTIYTPEVFVQGREMRRWRNRRAMEKRIEQVSNRQPEIGLTVSNHGIVDGKILVEISWQASIENPSFALHTAVTADQAQTNVRGGENGGQLLKHRHVVRYWHEPYLIRSASGKIRHLLENPNGELGDAQGAVVVFVEEPRGEVLQAVKVPKACSLDS